MTITYPMPDQRTMVPKPVKTIDGKPTITYKIVRPSNGNVRKTRWGATVKVTR